jgi:AcrR family transcriptional regulator
MNDLIQNQKYKDLIATARELFWKHGFRRVTVEEICTRAGISKMTFYKYFPNKIELAKMVFTREVNDGIEKFKQLIREELPPAKKIKKLILFKAEATNNISREFMEDFYLGNEPELKTFVETETATAWNGLLTLWKEAQEKGIFNRDIRPEFLLHISFKLVELIRDEGLNRLYPDPQELILEFTRFVAYGIAPHNE